MKTIEKSLLAAAADQEILKMNDEIKIDEPPIDGAAAAVVSDKADADAWWEVEVIHNEVRDYCRQSRNHRTVDHISNLLCKSCPCGRWIGGAGGGESFGCFCTELSQMIVMFVGDNSQDLGLPRPTRFCGLREVHRLQSDDADA